MEIKNLAQLKRVIQEKREFIIRVHRQEKFLGQKSYPDSRSMRSVVQIMEKEAGLILGKQLSGNFRRRHAVCICQKWSIYLKT